MRRGTCLVRPGAGLTSELQVDGITLSPFGGMTYCAHIPQAKSALARKGAPWHTAEAIALVSERLSHSSSAADILIALAGPLAHVPIGVIFYFLLDASAGNWWHVDDSGDA